MYFDLELRILETCTGYADVIGHITLLTSKLALLSPACYSFITNKSQETNLVGSFN